MPEIRHVTKDNWRELIEIQVREDQKNFVASNVMSIAESQFGFEEPGDGHWDFYPFGIYDGETPVGFLMYSLNYAHPTQQAFIMRLMVDEKAQGRGYGRFAMQKMLEIFRSDGRVQEVGISYAPANEVARAFYASLGFVEPGALIEGETLAVLKLR